MSFAFLTSSLNPPPFNPLPTVTFLISVFIKLSTSPVAAFSAICFVIVSDSIFLYISSNSEIVLFDDNVDNGIFNLCWSSSSSSSSNVSGLVACLICASSSSSNISTTADAFFIGIVCFSFATFKTAFNLATFLWLFIKSSSVAMALALYAAIPNPAIIKAANAVAPNTFASLLVAILCKYSLIFWAVKLPPFRPLATVGFTIAGFVVCTS